MANKKSYRDLAILIESSQDMRNSFKEALENAGFKEILIAGSVEEAWAILSQDRIPNWIVSSYYNEKTYNTAQLIGLMVQQPSLKDTMFSLLVTEEEFKYLPSAFEMSVLSFHKKPVVAEILSGQLKDMAEKLEAGESALKIAAANLREHFTITHNKNGLLRLETALFECLPSTPESYAHLAKAQFEAGEFDSARSTIIKAKHSMSEENDTIQSIGQKLAEKGEKYSTVGTPLSEILNLKSVLIIESDESQANVLRKALEGLTIESIHVTTTADESEAWVRQNLETVNMIISSWSLPGITGAGMIQRLQDIEGLGAIPIIITSSGLVSQDKLLLREMGIADSISKPIQEDELKRVVLSQANRHLATNEAQTIVRKFQNAIRNNRIKLAKQLFSKLSNLENKTDKLVSICEAEILFAEGEYEKCRDIATDCFKRHGEDVVVLNLMGKSYLKLGDHMSALKCLNRAHLLSPQNLDRLCNLAETQSEIGEDAAATSAINIAENVDRQSKKVQATKAAIAVNAGRLDDAKNVMEKSPVVRNMVAYMNNRAISLVMQGKVDKSLELYQNALKSLPAKNEKEKWILSYNYALACIRLEKLGEAMNTIKKIDIVKTDPLFIKINSLRKRLQDSLDNGKPMKLNLTDQEKRSGREVGIPFAIHCKPGELKLHHIFFAEDLANKEFVKALESIPMISRKDNQDLSHAS